MVANSAVLAALILLLGVFWVSSEVTFLAPFKRAIVVNDGVAIGLFLLVVFVNLFALCYGLARVLFLKDTGVKLHHMDQQLATQDTVLADLTQRLKED